MKIQYYAILSLLSVLMGCGGGNDSTNSDSVDTNTTPTNTVITTTTNTTTNTTDSVTTAMAQEIKLYASAPNLTACDSGELTQQAKAEALKIINTMRSYHELPAIVYDEQNNKQVMDMALMIAVNGELSHYPPASWKCYTLDGAEAAKTSNLSGGIGYSYQSIEADLIGYLTDINNKIANNVGHRRWFLNPFLTKITYGRVVTNWNESKLAQGSAVKVIYADSNYNSTFKSQLVAYPYKDYPAKYFASGAILSFALMIDASSIWNNNTVDYSQATIELKQRGGKALSVTDIQSDNTGYGLPNNLQFKATIEKNVYYDVIIKNIRYAGLTKDINYWFRIVD